MSSKVMKYAVANDSLRELYEAAKKLRQVKPTVITFIKLYEIDPTWIPFVVAKRVNQIVTHHQQEALRCTP
jgi:hypothetical protein